MTSGDIQNLQVGIEASSSTRGEGPPSSADGRGGEGCPPKTENGAEASTNPKFPFATASLSSEFLFRDFFRARKILYVDFPKKTQEKK